MDTLMPLASFDLGNGRTLPAADVQAFGEALDRLRDRVIADLGAKDARYIRRMIRLQRGIEILGRAMLFGGVLPPLWFGGVALLSIAKILENMEIGHNVMHGQYDFIGDPKLQGTSYEWDNVCPSAQWRHSHNFLHHTHTNIVGKDRDLGYGIIRVTAEQPWHPIHLLQVLYAIPLCAYFEWGVALHEVEVDRVIRGEKSPAQVFRSIRPVAKKAGSQVLKDYVLFPLLAGPFAFAVLTGNYVANIIRNVWSFAIIFCGHFTENVRTFSEEETHNESRGSWYLRQLLGSSNLEGGPVFHVLAGNLSHQIEHHLFPDLPAHRYAEIAVEVRALAAQHGIPYNTGSFIRQFGAVIARIIRHSLPRRSAPAIPALA